MNPQDARTQFHTDSMRFLLAQNVILASEIAARKGNAELLQRFDRFRTAAQPVYDDLYEYLCAHLFIAFISNFETFLQNIASYVVKRHPKKLGNIQFKLSEVLDTPNKEDLIERAIDEHLNRIMYKKPLEYLQDFCSLLSIDRVPIESSWSVFVEAKARRDLGVHAAWQCDATYLRKVQEVGADTALVLGASAIPGTKEYLNSVVTALRDLADHITEQVLVTHCDVEV